MVISFLATEPHFIDHLLPTYRALPDAYRGPWAVPPSLEARLPDDVEVGRWQIPSGPTLVASYGDLRRLPARAPAALSEHGAGQTYTRRHPSYAGGRGRSSVGLFLCQSIRVAAINERYWPGRRYEVVGVPRLDDLHRQGGRRLPDHSRTVVVGSHWDCTVVPETRWAWPHYRDRLVETLADAGWNVVGHSHPRVADHLAKWWASKGIGFVPEFDDVLTIADAYVVDNSSTLYEAASVGIPVVAMNAPWYRREVRHGLRFWDRIPGPTVDEAAELPAALDAACSPEWAARREQVMAKVFARRDGSAVEAAAAGIVRWADDGFPIVTDRRRYDAMADRTDHDPFAPRRKSGGTTLARAGDPVPARKADAETTATSASLVPGDADEVVDYLDAAETDDDRTARASAALAAEAARAPSRRHVSVLAALSEILGEETVDARLDEADNETAQGASGSPETADAPDGSGDTPEAPNEPEAPEGDAEEAAEPVDLDESGGMHGMDTPVADGEDVEDA